MNNNKIDTILFDLDGTLLPLEQDAFVQTYFGLLGKRGAILGYEPKSLIQGVWAGTKAMMQNDGSASNYARFWDAFAGALGEDIRAMEAEFEDFYATDFNNAQSVMGPIEDVKGILDRLKAKGYCLALATNPLFPPVAIRSRLGWVGLTVSYFDHITTYDNSSYCKPDPKYFTEILKVLGKAPSQCMMIGNNPAEDMAAGQLGIAVFLLTDNLENPDHLDISSYPQGDFAALEAMLDGLPSVC